MFLGDGAQQDVLELRNGALEAQRGPRMNSLSLGNCDHSIGSIWYTLCVLETSSPSETVVPDRAVRSTPRAAFYPSVLLWTTQTMPTPIELKSENPLSG